MVVLPVYMTARNRCGTTPTRGVRLGRNDRGDAGAMRVNVPLGDASDLAAIDAGRAESGNHALAAIAQRKAAMTRSSRSDGTAPRRQARGP